jgi:hypothetical protein
MTNLNNPVLARNNPHRRGRYAGEGDPKQGSLRLHRVCGRQRVWENGWEKSRVATQVSLRRVSKK